MNNMKITKHGHACLEVELDSQTLIIDPGSYTEELTGLGNVVAVVVTHKHDDHCDEVKIAKIKEANPEVLIFGTSEVAARLVNMQVTTVYHGDYYEVGNFKLEFFGDMHQIIHESIPLIQNTAVLVNGDLYYAGDSYTPPDQKIKILACPTSAPWLKIGDVMDYIKEVKPAICFPTHNALLSQLGHDLNNSRVKQVTEENGGEFKYLEVGQSLEI
jgi:L-ascorbate metabolism protein UlaG (beta-lactamase superfamily)